MSNKCKFVLFLSLKWNRRTGKSVVNLLQFKRLPYWQQMYIRVSYWYPTEIRGRFGVTRGFIMTQVKLQDSFFLAPCYRCRLEVPTDNKGS